MKWIETRVEIRSESSAAISDLVAGIFHDAGLRGTLIDDPHLHPEGEDWFDGEYEPPHRHAITAWLPLNNEARRQREVIKKRLRQLEEAFQIETYITYRTIDEEDWAESWKVHFKPIRVCANIVIKPAWETFHSQTEDIVIDIDPGMAFGTGSHPTTALCLSLIKQYLKPGDAFLDIGTGSGILSIAAAKLGAGRVVGVDVDENAVGIATDNMKRNGMFTENCRFAHGHLLDEVNESFNIITANILTDVVLELLPDLNRVLKPDSIFICSGIIEDDRDKVVNALGQSKYELLQIRVRESWVGIAAKRK